MPPFIGSAEHKELLSKFFIDSHDPYKPTEMPWPELEKDARDRLAMLPIWEEALRTEAEPALAVTTRGEVEKAPVLAKAISLQGYEEARHAEILRLLVTKYKIDVPDFKTEKPVDPDWAFMRI